MNQPFFAVHFRFHIYPFPFVTPFCSGAIGGSWFGLGTVVGVTTELEGAGDDGVGTADGIGVVTWVVGTEHGGGVSFGGQPIVVVVVVLSHVLMSFRCPNCR
jgi:hypothetical protein